MHSLIKNTKIYVLVLFVFLGFVLIILRLAYIQLIGRTDYIEKVVEKLPKASVERVPVYRGAIKDRNGIELAISVPTIHVFAFPHSVKNKEELPRRLSAVMDQMLADLVINTN